MKKGFIRFGIGVTVLSLGIAYVAKKTGFFEDDSHLYDEFEA